MRTQKPDEVAMPIGVRETGDAGADLITPWRRPVRTVAHAVDPLDTEVLGFSPATAAEAVVQLKRRAPERFSP